MPPKKATQGTGETDPGVEYQTAAAPEPTADPSALFTRKDATSRDVFFPLTHTSPGKHARVRRLPLVKLITISNTLSPTMQGVVLEVFKNVKPEDTEVETAFAGTILDRMAKNDVLVNGVCILGFKSPRLTETEDEADQANDPNVAWVEEIEQADRQAYYDLVNDSEGEAAKALVPFPKERLDDPAAYEGVPPPPPPIEDFTFEERIRAVG